MFESLFFEQVFFEYILVFIDTTAYHTVIGLCQDHIRVITVYIPEEGKWIEYRRRRNVS